MGSKFYNIKHFDADSDALNKFILRCENVVTTFSVLNHSELNKHILECIQEKRKYSRQQKRIKQLEKHKDTLKTCFSDRRDLDCVMQELTRSKPDKDKNFIWH